MCGQLRFFINSMKRVRYIQSCITTVSFPEKLDGVLNMVRENRFIANWSTDLDVLLNSKREEPLFWTAPKWLTEGDIIFFYNTKRAKILTARLLEEAKENLPHKRKLIDLLKRAKEAADLYAGSIFACASVSGDTKLLEKQNKHFVSRLFAPLEEVFIFKKPLHQELFAHYLKIGRSTITPLFKKEFNGIRKLLTQENQLPEFLLNAVLSDQVFSNVNPNNWRSISCSPDTKFVHESQLRSYLIDFLLNELKDRGTPLLEECECFRGSKKTGRVDYFVKIFRRWIPVEVKLDIYREKRIFAQAAKYMNISYFSPAKGAYRKRQFESSSVPLCIILDRAGMYLITPEGKFTESDLSKPFWKRENFTKGFAEKIRNEIKKHFN